MSEEGLPVSFQDELVEEAVLRAIRGRGEEREFFRARSPLYRLPSADRDRAFAEFHGGWFRRLQLAGPIHAALAELAILRESCGRCLVTRAFSPRDEGADMLVAEADRTVVLRLCATAFDDRSKLLTWLRAELLHVADMVDPAFGYDPVLPASGDPACERLLRDRYRVLWDVTIAGRLLRRGLVSPEAQREARLAFASTFPMLGQKTDAAFVRFFGGEACGHADLLAFATSPGGEDIAARLAPGSRCPLCRFVTFAPEPAPENLPEEIVEHIVADFPLWRPFWGLCRQCADLYRSRAMSIAEAERLPRAC